MSVKCCINTSLFLGGVIIKSYIIARLSRFLIENSKEYDSEDIISDQDDSFILDQCEPIILMITNL